MQYVFLLFFICLLLYDLRKGILIYAPFKLFFLTTIKFEFITFDVLVSIVAFFVYIFKYQHILVKRGNPWIYALITGIIFSIIAGFIPKWNGGNFWMIFTVYLYAVIFLIALIQKSILNSHYLVLCFAIIMCKWRYRIYTWGKLS